MRLAAARISSKSAGSVTRISSAVSSGRSVSQVDSLFAMISRTRTGSAGFGAGGAPGGTVRTAWNTKKIWLRRHVVLDKVPAKPLFSLHHDEDTKAWINGVPAGSYRGYTTSYELVGIAPRAARALRTGDNVIATETRQTVGGQYIDWGLSESIGD